MRQNNEHHLQVSMIQWYNAQYPKLRLNLFAVPNGSNIGQRAGAYMRAEGLRSGVSDLIFCYDETAYFIEIKTPKGKQSDSQKQFQQAMSDNFFEYYIIRTFDDFKLLITILIKQPHRGDELAKFYPKQINRT